MTDTHTADIARICAAPDDCFLPASSTANSETLARAETRARAWTARLAQLLTPPTCGEPQEEYPLQLHTTRTNAKGTVLHSVHLLRAGGPLLPHERALCERLGIDPKRGPRLYLNGWHLGAGLSQMRDLLNRGGFALTRSHEGVALFIAWLLEQGHDDAAAAMLAPFTPFLTEVRLYPQPCDEPSDLPLPQCIRLIEETRKVLRAVPQSQRTTALRTAIRIWLPLFDRVVSLFAETRDPQGQPCQHWPSDWRARAAETVDAVRSAGLMPHRRHFMFLFRILEIAVNDPASLTARHIGRVRLILDDIARTRGLPGDPRHEALRDRQQAEARKPSQHDLAQVVAQRLDNVPARAGLTDIEPWVRPVTEQEAAAFDIAVASPVSAFVRKEVERSLSAPIHELGARGVFREPDDILPVYNGLAANAQRAWFADPRVNRVYEKQLAASHWGEETFLSTLPARKWLHALMAFTQIDVRSAWADELTVLVDTLIRTFPHDPIPMSFWSAPAPDAVLRMLRYVASEANITLPAPPSPPPPGWMFWKRDPAPSAPSEARIPLEARLTNAAFFASSTPERLHAIQLAGPLLADTPYARYYDIDYAHLNTNPRLQTYGRHTAAELENLCTERARASHLPPRSRGKKNKGAAGHPPDLTRIAVNDLEILEQAHVLSANNLALLLTALPLSVNDPDVLERLSQLCFTWICKRLSVILGADRRQNYRRARIAHAWRYMLAYQSLIRPSRFDAFTAWARQHLSRSPSHVRALLEPYVEGLHSGHPTLLTRTDSALRGR